MLNLRRVGEAVMKRQIFISYRRDDARADARSIYQRLQGTFGTKKLFMDVDTIEHGRDFRKVIETHLANSAVLLVLIGRNWLGTGRDAQDRRLDDPADLVRMEVASGLRRDIPVIPVLIDGAQMPSAKDLPEEIRELAYRQASRVTYENFASDMDRIERDLHALTSPSLRWKLIVSAIVVLCAAALGIGLHQFKGSIWDLGKATITERAFTSFMDDTDLPGGDYTSHGLSKPDPLLCQKLCAEDQRCLAWTYVAPGYVGEARAICWLKNTVPTARRTDDCCTSGVAYYRRTQQ
jgi:hypothetical protein